MAYSSFLVARGLAAVFFGAGLSPDASASDAFAPCVVFLPAGLAPVSALAASSLVSAFASALESALAAGLVSDAFASALASDFGVAWAGFLASVFLVGAFACAASFAASSA